MGSRMVSTRGLGAFAAGPLRERWGHWAPPPAAPLPPPAASFWAISHASCNYMACHQKECEGANHQLNPVLPALAGPLSMSSAKAALPGGTSCYDDPSAPACATFERGDAGGLLLSGCFDLRICDHVAIWLPVLEMRCKLAGTPSLPWPLLLQNGQMTSRSYALRPLTWSAAGCGSNARWDAAPCAAA